MKTIRNEEKSIVKAIVDATKMLFVGQGCHEHKIMDRNFGRKSNAIVVCDSVPKDCIERVVCDDGNRILFPRVLTPRPRPKVALGSKRQISQQQQHQQQQQQQQYQQQLRLSLTALLHMLGLSVELHGRVPVTWLVQQSYFGTAVCASCIWRFLST